jgi:RND family efflux transporter MFP subunit
MINHTILTLLALMFLVSCSDNTPTKDQHQTSSPLVSVTVEQVTRTAVPMFYSAAGYTNVSRIVEISTSQSATIHELKVKEGDLIEQGDLLIVLDESELLTSIRLAENSIKSAQIQLKDLAQDYINAKTLKEKRVITHEQLRKAKVQFNLAETRLSQAENELKKQLARKPYHRINSPISARVIKRWVEQGDLALIGKPLLQLEALGGLEFETALPARWTNTLNVGDIYPLKIHNRNKPVNAVVSHIVNSVDRVTQTYKVKLALSDSGSIQAGLSGQIDFVIGKEDQLLVSSSAIIKRAGVFGVFRAHEGKARFTPVNIERRWQDYYLVLSGLNEHDQVIISSPEKLKDGTAIDTTVEQVKYHPLAETNVQVSR